MSRPATLSDVAKAANVSPTTVSRHLNGSISLPEETVRRIDAAISALRYRPNPHARSLGRGRSDMIGLVIPDIANPFFAKLAAAVEIAADGSGLGVMLCSTFNRQARELEYIDRMRKNFVDGLLFATNHTDDGALAASINASSGVVLVDEDVAGTSGPKVFADNEQGGALAAQCLLASGHRRLAYVGGPHGLMSARERAEGFRKVARETAVGAGVSCELFGEYTAAHGRAAIKRILDEHSEVTGVFAASDEILIGMLEVLRARQRRVGSDISVVTFDDVEPLGLLDPPVTAVRQFIDEMGRTAVGLITVALAGAPQVETVRVPVELVVRGSVGPPKRSRELEPARNNRQKLQAPKRVPLTPLTRRS
jgi:LacI family transcriptional regulator